MPRLHSIVTAWNPSDPHQTCGLGKRIISTLQVYQMEVTEGSANSKAVVSVTRLGSPGGKDGSEGVSPWWGREEERRDAGCWGPKEYKGPEPLDVMPLDLQVLCTPWSCSSPDVCAWNTLPWYTTSVSFPLLDHLTRGASTDYLKEHHLSVSPTHKTYTLPYLDSPHSTYTSLTYIFVMARKCASLE